jgi:hypothetical protein
MANPKIEVEIGAVIDGLRKGFGESVKIIETLEKQALDLDKALKAATDLPTIQNLNSQLAQTKAALSQLKNSGIDPLTKATSNYNSVGVDFARIIQDAPFGIIGVGNNITQLAGSFQVLKNQTGSTSAALKQSFASIFSSGNALILGISLLTTAFTLLQQNGFFKSEEAAKSLTEKLKEYEESLKGVAAANLKGAQDAQKEISTLKGLEIQATNTALSNKQRNDAVNELQKLYPEYFANLTKEQIKNGDVGEAYIKVTESLIAKAKAQAATNAIAQNAIEILTIETKLEDLKAQRLLKTANAQAQVDALIEKRQKEGFLTQGDLQRYDTLIKSINTANESLKEEEVLQKEIVKIRKEDEQLIGKLNTSLEEGGNLIKDTGKAIDQNKDKLKQYSEGWDEYNLKQETAKELQDKLTFSAKDYESQILKVLKTSKEPILPQVTGDNAWDQYTFSVYQLQKASFEANKEITETSNKALEFGDRIKSLEGKEIKIKTTIEGFEDENAAKRPFDVFLDDVALQLDKLPSLQERVADFAKQTNDLIKGSVTDAFIDLGYTIGETLATGGNVLKAVGGSLLKSFANFLGRFGQQLIAYGVAASAFGKVSAALANPASAIIAAPLAIAAGIALTAIAGAIGSLGSKGPGGGGGGGGAGGGSAAPAGTSFTGGGVGGMFAQNRDVSGEFVVRGQDLVYVLGQSENRIKKG